MCRLCKNNDQNIIDDLCRDCFRKNKNDSSFKKEVENAIRKKYQLSKHTYRCSWIFSSADTISIYFYNNTDHKLIDL